MSLRLGSVAPDFEAKTTHGDIKVCRRDKLFGILRCDVSQRGMPNNA